MQFGALTHAHGALTVILVHFFPANSFVSVSVNRGVRAHAHGRKLTVSIPQHSSSLVSRLPQRGTVPAGNLATPVTVLSRTPRPLLGGRGHGYRKRQICVSRQYSPPRKKSVRAGHTERIPAAKKHIPPDHSRLLS